MPWFRWLLSVPGSHLTDTRFHRQNLAVGFFNGYASLGDDGHGVSIGEKAVTGGHRLLVGRQNPLPAREG